MTSSRERAGEVVGRVLSTTAVPGPGRV